MRNQMFTVTVLVLTASFANAQDTVANPEFTNWSKFPKGTSVVMKISSTAAGMTSETSMTTTLLEVGADKVVVETATAIKANGMEFKTPAMKRDVAKSIPLPKGTKKEDLAGGKPPGTLEEGTETLKVGGVEVKTKWYRFKLEAGGVTTESKMWRSDDVPGMMVKMEATTTGTVASTTKMELVEFKKP
ncbi:MAG: hypothetical protein C0467_20460 [Planctomycetaceae bacterium]|nr:hypothetical protein [Planctomycetaceae bacterium]